MRLALPAQRKPNHGKKTPNLCFFKMHEGAQNSFKDRSVHSRGSAGRNITAHPTAEWTLQQFREALPGDHLCRFVIHDRDRIFSADVDKSLTNVGVQVLRTPVRVPKANPQD